MRESALPIVVMGSLLLSLVVASTDAESGVSAWFELRAELSQAQARIVRLEAENENLQDEANALKEDAFAIERAIREDLELARRGETVLRFRGSTGLGVEEFAPASALGKK